MAHVSTLCRQDERLKPKDQLGACKHHDHEACLFCSRRHDELRAGHAVGIADNNSRHSVGLNARRECAHIQKQKFCTFDEDCMLVVKESHA